MPNSTRKLRSRPYALGALCVALAAVVLLILELTNTIDLIHKKHDTVNTPTSGGSSVDEQKGEPQTTQTSTGSSSTAQPGDNKSNSSTDSSANLVTPTGNFVSAHGTSEHPVALSATLASVCNTTPGVSCKITFTSSEGVVKSLGAQETDRGGSTYWNSWTPASIGLTAGTWQVKAVVTSGDQTKSATDAMELVVS